MAGRQVRIFISSPGDVAEERRRAAIVINRLAREFARFFDLGATLWEYEPMLASGHFQDAIVKPSQSDIVVMIVWSRLGTPLPERYRGADGRAPVTGTEWEFEEALAHRAERGLPDLLVYRKDLPGRAEFQSEDQLELARGQWRTLQDFWTRHFLAAEGGFKAAFNSFRDLDGFETQLEAHLRQLLRQRLPQFAARAQQDQITWTEGSPFRGLETYEAEHAAVFFGREQAEREVIEALARHAEHGIAFLLLLGMSGSGKSSLVRAGVVPTLTVPGVVTGVSFWRPVLFRPGADPLAQLARAVIRQGLAELPETGIDESALARQWRATPNQGALPIEVGLRAAEKADRSGIPGSARLILLVDQMEELLTLPKLNAADRDAFVALLDALTRSGRVWVIATLRGDFYHRLDEIPGLRDLSAERIYNLTQPRLAEVGEMVRRPAQAAGIEYETEEVSGLGLDAIIEEAAGRDPAALPLMSFALDELYRRDITEAGGEILRVDTYRRLGGLEGAIAQRAEEVCAALPYAEVAAVLRELVTLREDRDEADARPISRAPAATTPQREQVVEVLIEARLIVGSGSAAGPVIRLAHEALIRHWPRLSALIAADREFLRQRTRLQRDCNRWQGESRTPDLLLPPGRRLAEGAELLATRRDDLDPATAEFIEVSIARDRAINRRQLRRTQIFAGVVSLLALVAVGFGLIADRQRRRADRSFAAAVVASDTLVTQVARRMKPLTSSSATTVRAILGTAEAAFDRLADTAPKSTLLQARRAVMLNAFVDIDLALGDKPEALRRALAARRLMEPLTASNPDNSDWQLTLAESRRWAGDVLQAEGDVQGALTEFRASLAIRQGLLERHPEQDGLRGVLGIGYGRLGYLLEAQRDYAGARAQFRAALDLREGLERAGHSDPTQRRNISIGHRDIGDTLRGEGNLAGAADEYRQALQLATSLASAAPDDAELQDDVAAIHQRLGDVLRDDGGLTGALGEYRAALDVVRRLAERDPDRVLWQSDMAIDGQREGEVLLRQGDVIAAAAAFRASLVVQQRLVAKHPGDIPFQRALMIAYIELAAALEKQDDRPKLLEALQAAEKIASDVDTTSHNPASAAQLGAIKKALLRVRSKPATPAPDQ